MEAASMIFRPVIGFSGSGIDSRSPKLQFCDLGSGNHSVSCRARDCSGFLSRGFSDPGHVQFYARSIKCGGKKEKDKEITSDKKKLKLIKRLSKDLSVFSAAEVDRTLIGEVKGKMISEATEVLLAELKHLRSKQKEQKRKKKEEKARKKATLMKNGSESSSSSDSESGEVIDMNCFRSNAAEQSAQSGLVGEIIEEEATLISTSIPTQEEDRAGSEGANDTSLANRREDCCDGTGDKNGVAALGSGMKIEVCMGGKCKKMGAGALIEEFERRVGSEEGGGAAVVVGCKCMGKCKSGPNVRVLNGSSGNQDVTLGGSLMRTQLGNPLCIGVGLDDVDAIVDGLLGINHWNDKCLPAQS